MSAGLVYGNTLEQGFVGESEQAIPMEKLKKWNFWAGVLHFVQAVLMVAASQAVERIREFRLPLTTTFLAFNETSKALSPEMKEVGSVPIGPIVSIFLFLSALAHFMIVSPWYYPYYVADIKRGMNQARWYEYAVSSSLMIALIAMLFGCYDIASLLLIIACNASMNLFGLLMEKINQYTEQVEWSSFWFGTAAGGMPWVVVLMYFLGGGNYSDIPAFVYGILAAYAVFFNTFPINMVLQYKKYGKWEDYRYGEMGYIVLSLVSKSLLAWIVFGGTQQPTDES
jgi:hypothetical protein